MATFVYSGVTYTSPAEGTTEFALTSDTGNAIGYLSQDHIYVYSSTDAGATWSKLTATTDYTFNSQGTEIVLTSGTTAGQQIRLQRKTPLSAQYVTFSDGSLLTSNQLNQAELFSLYCDQELADGEANIDGSVEGYAVKKITADLPLVVDSSKSQEPHITIEKYDSTDDPEALTSDTSVVTAKAIDESFKQYVGASPSTGKKVGQLRIDDTGGVPKTFYWTGSTWVQIQTRGEQGPEGPEGPAPGLQSPPASAATVALNEDGTLGTPTAQVEQDPSTKDLKFLFGIPQGLTGAKGADGTNGTDGAPGKDGEDGKDSTVPGPPPGLQSPAGVATSVPVNPDGSTGTPTVSVTQDGNKDLKFEFGIPVGQRGPEGPEGPPGDGVNYKGPIDATTAAEPSNPANGDFYMNTVAGTSSWTGLGTVSDGTRIIWNSGTSQWDAYEPTAGEARDTNLGYTAAADKGTITNDNGTGAEIPVASLSDAGLMSPGDKGKLNNIQAGAEKNPDLSNYIKSGDDVSELTNDANYITLADVPALPSDLLKSGDNVSELINDAGYITASQVPATGVTSVNGDSGPVVELGLQQILDQGNTSTTDLWIGTGGQTVKLLGTGTVEASADVKAKAFRIDLLETLP